MMSAPVTHFLETLPLCEGMTRAELAAFAELLEPQRFPARTKIIREGDPGTVFYFLREGSVGVFRGTGVDGPRRVATLSPPEAIGHLCLLDGQPREATCVSDETILLLVGTKRRFDACFDRGDTFAFKLIENIAKDLCRRVRRVSEAFYQFYAQPQVSIRHLERLAREVAKRKEREIASARYVRVRPERQRQRPGVNAALAR